MEDDDQPWTEDDYTEAALEMIEDMAEDFGLGSAVSTFLGAIASISVETNTVGAAIDAMQGAVELMLRAQAHRGPMLLN